MPSKEAARSPSRCPPRLQTVVVGSLCKLHEGGSVGVWGKAWWRVLFMKCRVLAF